MRILAFVLVAGCWADLGPQSAAANADRCGECHVEEAREFVTSRHAVASSSELFQVLRQRAEDELAAGQFCDDCHRPDQEQALTCNTCHAVAGNTAAADGQLVHDPAGPVRGPTGDGGDAPHATAASDLLVESEICGTCHDTTGLRGFQEHPFKTWKQSIAAERGERCQDCHMGPGSDHSFTGLIAGDEEAAALLAKGIEVSGSDGVWTVQSLTGHEFPDGASFLREIWLEGERDGELTGEKIPLHAQLRVAGHPTWDPLLADEVRPRGLAVDEARDIALDADILCLRMRRVGAELASHSGLPADPPVTVACY